LGGPELRAAIFLVQLAEAAGGHQHNISDLKFVMKRSHKRTAIQTQ
jgi:gentisate 1,2-dioxygenase